ncbi:hypothetical protein [Agromyces flavus]|uniref:hypothetical protein n=1 Tax=Agromyces flavus TaxID=589382 RepID=UPI003622B2F0
MTTAATASTPPRHPLGGRRRPSRRGDAGAPAIVLFTMFMAAPIVYTVILSFQKEVVNGLGLGSGARSRQFAGLENYVASLTSPEFLASVGRVLVYGLILVRPCSASALFALLLDAPAHRRQGILTRLDLPAVRGAGGHLVAAVGLPLPARVSPFYWVFEQLGWGCHPAVAGSRDLRDRQHRPLGRRRLQHDRDLHVIEGRAAGDLRGRRIDGASEAQIACASRCRSSCRRSS